MRGNCIWLPYSVVLMKLIILPAQDKPYPVVRVHEPREPVNEMPAEDAVGDGRICTLKNTLRNGIVIGALERRYDHMVLIERRE